MSSFPNQNPTYPMRLVSEPNKWDDLLWAYHTSIPKPKRILAEGDSWLAYPQLLGVKNIVWHLANNDDYKDVLLLSLAYSGDTAVSMLTNREKFLETISHYEFDYLLFSGGGNDIVGKWDFDFILNEYKTGMTAEDCVNTKRFERRIEQIKLAYMDLLEYTFTYAKSKDSIKIITHTYDKAIPNKKGVVSNTSWMWPYLVAKGITNNSIQRKIALNVLGAFADMINELASSTIAEERFIVVETRGTIIEDEWENEIHPNTKGFKKIADKIYKKL